MKIKFYHNAVKRLLMWNLLSGQLDLILVSEFPKSGATWFCKMFSEATEIPFPNKRIPDLKQSILHEHHLFSPRMNKAITVMRDGRDVMVSAYFHFLFFGNDKSPKTTQLHRSKISFKDYDNVEKNMPAFIKYMFVDYANRNFLHFSWSQFVHNIEKYENSLCVIKYEDMLTDTVGALEKALNFYEIESPGKDELQNIVDNYSFKKMTKRKPGEEDRHSFVRKGISGDWKNHFTEEACEMFKKYAGKELIKAGYETNNNWRSHLK